MIPLPDLRARLRLDTSEFERGIRKTSRTLQRTGRQLKQTGTTLSRNLSLPIFAAGAAAIKLSVDFESAMGNIRALVGASSEQVDAWSQDILSLAKGLPQAPKELADALYFVTSSGIATGEAMDVVEQSARAAAAGLGQTQTVADAVTSAMNAYGSAALSAEQATDILTATVREGKGEPEELAASIGRVIAPAQALGVEFNEVGGAFSSLTLLGLDAAEAATGFRGILSSLLKPAEKSRAEFERLGISVDQMRQNVAEKGLLPSLLELRKKIGNNKDAIGNLFPNVRALNAFLILTGENAEKNTEIFGELANATGATDKAFEEASKTTGFKLKRALSSLQVSAIKLGDTLAPVFAKLATFVAGLAEKLSSLGPVGRAVALTFAGIGLVVGPLLRVAGSLVLTFGKLYKAFVLLRSVGSSLQIVGALDQMSRGVTVGGKFSTTLSGVKSSAGTLGSSLKSLITTAINPVTIAVGIAIANFVEWSKKKREVAGLAHDVADALQAEAKGVEGASDAALLADIRSKDLFEDLRAAGVSVPRYIAAIKGEIQLTADEVNRLADTSPILNRFGEFFTGRGTDAATVLHEMQQGFKDGRLEVEQLADAEAYLHEVEQRGQKFHRSTTESLDKGNAARDRLAASAKRAGKKQEDLAGGLVKVKDSAEEAEKKLKKYQDRWDRILGVSLDWSDAKIALKDAIADLTKQFKENGDSLNINTKKGRENRSAANDLIRKVKEETDAWADKTKHVETDRERTRHQIRALKDLKKQFPGLKDFIQEYINKLNKIPKHKDTTLGIKAPIIEYNIKKLKKLGKTTIIPSSVGFQEFHTGGWVPGPIGKERLILAKGGERVQTPAQARSSGGDTIVININGAGDPVRVARLVESRISAARSHDARLARMRRDN